MKHFTQVLLVFLCIQLCSSVKAQGQWDSVSGNGFGSPFISVDRMLSFNGKIYAATKSSYSIATGAHLYYSATGDTGSWKMQTGLDSIWSTKQGGPDAIGSLASTTSGGGYLFAGATFGSNYPGIFRYNGTKWSDCSPAPGMYISASGNYEGVTSMCAFSTNGNGDSIFAAVGNPNSGAELYAAAAGSASPVWTNVLTTPDANAYQFTAMKVFQGKIYACTNGTGYVFQSANGINWTRIAAADTGFHNINVSGFTAMEVFNNELFVAGRDNNNGAALYKSADGINWTLIQDNGFGLGSNYYSIDDLHAAGGKLWTSGDFTVPSIIKPNGNSTRGAKSYGNFIHYSSDGMNFKVSDSTGFNHGNHQGFLTDLNYKIYYGGTNTGGNGGQIWRTCLAPVASYSVPALGKCAGSPLALTGTMTNTLNYMWILNGIHEDSVQATYTFTPATAATYTVVLKAFNGTCVDSVFNAIAITGLPSVNAGGAQSICKNGSISLLASISGGTKPFTYSWSNGSSADTAMVHPSASVLYTVHVSDQMGCKGSDTLTVHVLPVPSVNLGGPLNTCTTDSFTLKPAVAGGTAPYTYLWCSGATTDSIRVSVTVTASYTVTVRDKNGCMAMDTMTLHVVSPPTIAGTVTSTASGNITSGYVFLIYYNALPEKQFVVDSVPIVNGAYSVTGFHDGNYLIFAKPSKALYPNAVRTYSPQSDAWAKAALVTAPCNTTVTANINVIELTPLSSGTGTLTGSVTKGPGFGNSHRFNPIPGVLGEPIPGLDVNLEQHPGGIIVAHDTTDAGGVYSFGHVPPGTYSIYVDIPGLGLVSQYSRTITSSDNWGNLDYVVDSTHIYKDSLAIVTGIQPVSGNENNLTVAPNPFRDLLNISYTLTDASPVTLEIYNVLGQQVTSLVNQNQEAGSYRFHLDTRAYNLSSGIYLLKLTVDGKPVSRRLLSLH